MKCKGWGGRNKNVLGGEKFQKINSICCFNLRLQIATGVTRITWVSEREGLKTSKNFWASTLIEAGAGEDTGSYMSPKLETDCFAWGD